MAKLLIFNNNLLHKNTNSTSINIITDNSDISFNYIDSNISQYVSLQSTSGISIINKNTPPNFILKGLANGSNLSARSTSNILYIDAVDLGNEIVLVSSILSTSANNLVADGTGPLITLKNISTSTDINLRAPYVTLDSIEAIIPSYGEVNFSPLGGLDYISFAVSTSYISPDVTTIKNTSSTSEFDINSNGWLTYSGSSGAQYIINSSVTLQLGGGVALVSLSINNTTTLYSSKHVSINSQTETHTINTITELNNGDNIFLSFLGSGIYTAFIHYLSLSARRIGNL